MRDLIHSRAEFGRIILRTHKCRKAVHKLLYARYTQRRTEITGEDLPRGDGRRDLLFRGRVSRQKVLQHRLVAEGNAFG